MAHCSLRGMKLPLRMAALVEQILNVIIALFCGTTVSQFLVLGNQQFWVTLEPPEVYIFRNMKVEVCKHMFSYNSWVWVHFASRSFPFLSIKMWRHFWFRILKTDIWLTLARSEVTQVFLHVLVSGSEGIDRTNQPWDGENDALKSLESGGEHLRRWRHFERSTGLKEC